MEHNVTCRAGGVPVLRATVDYRHTAAGFAESLAAVATVARQAAARLARPAPEPLDRLVTAVFDDPDGVPPATAFGLWLGVGPGVVKLYASLTVPGGADAAALCRRWPEHAPAAQAVVADGLADARLAAVRVGEKGAVELRTYARPRPGAGHGALSRAAARCGLGGGAVLAAVAATGLHASVWAGDLVQAAATRAGPPADERPRLAVHLSTAGVRDDRQRGLDITRAACRRLIGSEAAADVLDADMERRYGQHWYPSALGLAFHPSGEVDRVTIYAVGTTRVQFDG